MLKSPTHISFAMLALLACNLAKASPDGPTGDKVRAAISEAGRAFSDAFVRNDSEAIKRLYTENATLLPPGRDVRGRDAVGKYFQWGPRYRQVAHSMTPAELMVRGDVVVDIGTWVSTGQRGDEPPSTAAGRYLVVWVREADGRWRIQYDMWHQPGPAPTKTPFPSQ
jgi:ketosteroid isomerase-like protein